MVKSAFRIPKSFPGKKKKKCSLAQGELSRRHLETKFLAARAAPSGWHVCEVVIPGFKKEAGRSCGQKAQPEAGRKEPPPGPPPGHPQDVIFCLFCIFPLF